jgi:YidC/Oxa1 family membrane protein insertase
MNRDNIIGLILIFVILIGFSILNAPSEEEKLEAQRQRDSIAAVRAEEQIAREAAAVIAEENIAAEKEEIASIENDSLRDSALKDRLGFLCRGSNRRTGFLYY